MKRQWLLVAAILWFFSTGCWLAALWADFYYRETPEGLVIMHGITALVSLVAAIVNLLRYREKEADDEESN